MFSRSQLYGQQAEIYVIQYPLSAMAVIFFDWALIVVRICIRFQKIAICIVIFRIIVASMPVELLRKVVAADFLPLCEDILSLI